MNLFKSIGFAVSKFFHALAFIFKKGLWLTFFIPLILNILILSGGIDIIDRLTDYFFEWQMNLTTNSDTFFAEMIKGTAGAVLKFLIKILLFTLLLLISGHIVLILMSPVFAFVAEKTYNIMNRQQRKTETNSFLSNMFRGISISIINIFVEIALFIFCFFFMFIPVLGWFSPLILFVGTSFLFGYSFIDYSNEQEQLSVSQSYSKAWRYRWYVTSSGAIYTLILLIPLCNVMLASFATLVCVVAATIGMYEIRKKQEFTNK